MRRLALKLLRLALRRLGYKLVSLPGPRATGACIICGRPKITIRKNGALFWHKCLEDPQRPIKFEADQVDQVDQERPN
jgi:hypothetical protein